MRLRSLLPFLILITCLFACKDSGKDFTIVGNIDNMPPQTVFLEELGINDISIVDSGKTNEKGAFELSGTAPEPGLYRIRFQQDQFILVTLDKGTVKITGNWNDLAATYDVKGSASSSSLRQFLTVVREQLKDFNTLSVVMDTMHARGNDSLLAQAKKEMEDKNFAFTRYIEQYSDTTKFLPNAIFAVKMLNPASEKEYFQIFSQSIVQRFPNSKLAKDFSGRITQLYAMGEKAAVSGIQIGAQAPEIDLPTADGKNVKLSSFKGKYVLVDFWASWCGPCRGENPNVVAAYNQYKGKNFTILGVSLDNDKDKWIKAVEKDNLTWTHISDLKGWESVAARTYGVESIPANFLVDPAGKIVARDLRGEALEQELSKVLK